MLTRLILRASPPLAAFALLAPVAQAATSYYVSPTGAGALCARAQPCSLGTGAAAAQAGDFVVLLDGMYAHQQLMPANSGTASAWITFIADDGAVPILDGKGADPTAVAVSSDTAVYVRFIGIVARNWAGGFSNRWIGSTTDFSGNGNWQYIDCISDGNTRNGFAFNSAKGVLMRECISAHNGTSTTASWSSGFQLYGVQGTPADNVVERNVAFENMDAQKRTDGNGFIVDTMVTGTSFLNNIAFLNGGSGIRITNSKNIVIVNNTFYHDGQDTTDNNPPNPGEVYFTTGSSPQTSTLVNNVGVASGTTQDPSSAWVLNGLTLGTTTNNLATTSSTIFVAPDGTNPDFQPVPGSAMIDKGATSNAPALDSGFDPKCITRSRPTDIAVPSWTKYSVDFAYIKSIGGVAHCWKPGMRPAGTGFDIGAYEVNATAAPRTGVGPLPPEPSSPVDAGAGAGSGGGGGSGGSAGGGSTAASGGTGGSGGSGGTGGTGSAGGASAASNGGTGGPNGGSGASGSDAPTAQSGNGGAPSGCAVGLATGSTGNEAVLALLVPAWALLRTRRVTRRRPRR